MELLDRNNFVAVAANMSSNEIQIRSPLWVIEHGCFTNWISAKDILESSQDLVSLGSTCRSSVYLSAEWLSRPCRERGLDED